MNFAKRGFLYLIRKNGKTISLLILISVISTLILSGIAIRDASKIAQLNVRQALGGIFTLNQNTSDPDKWVNTKIGNYGTQSYYAGAPLTTELADYITNNVEGIRGYNASYVSYVIAADTAGKTLELLSDGTENEMDSLITGYGDFNSTVSAYGSTDTSFDSYFTGGYLSLTEGRHLTADDKNAILVSREFAELNKLKVGDKVSLHMSEFKASMIGIDADNTNIEVEIVGLFHATAKSTTSFSNWSMNNSIYTTLDVIHHVRPDTKDEGYEKIQFYVDDPGNLENITKQIESLPDFHTDDFVINIDSSNVDSVTKPLANMNRLTSVMIGLTLAIGVVILYLILSGRIKERMHEGGILLSLGIPKWKIIAQYFTEMILIAALSFTISVFCSNTTAQTIGNHLLDYATSDTTEENTSSAGITKDGITVLDNEAYKPEFQEQGDITQIDVAIDTKSIVGLYGFGFLIVCISVIIAALPVLRLKPREILSKMC